MCQKGCCETEKCCNEKRVSVAGKKGDKGDRGPTGLTGPIGPQGPASVASYQTVASSSALAPVPTTTPTLIPGLTLNVTPGEYTLDFDGTAQIINSGDGDRSTINYGAYLDGVSIPSTERVVDTFHQTDGAQENYCYSSMSTRSIQFTVAIAGVVDLRAFASYGGADTRPSRIINGVLRVLKLS